MPSLSLVLIGIVAALLPSVLWFLVFRWWDRHEPEPLRLLAALFCAGMGAGIGMYGIQYILTIFFVSTNIFPALGTPTFDAGIFTILVAACIPALIQEPLKLYTVRLFAFSSPAFTQVVDGVVYATTVSFGVACMENIWMIAHILRTSSLFSFPEQRIFQLLFTTLMLGVSAGYAGFALGQWRFAPKTYSRFQRTLLLSRGLFEAMLLHGAFQLFILLESTRVAGLLVILASLYLFSRFAVSMSTNSLPRPLKY